MPEATESELGKAVIIPEGGEPIRVSFNPTEYKLDKSVSHPEKKVQGYSSPVTQFSSGESETLSMDLLFDAYEEDDQDVRKYTEPILDLQTVSGKKHRTKNCRFVWGGLDFEGVLQSASTQYVMFLPSGVPVRARMSVTFKGISTIERQRKEIGFSSPDKSKLHVVTDGDTLPLLAHAEYGDPTKWRPIAEENDIDNPRVLRSGDELVVPTLES